MRAWWDAKKRVGEEEGVVWSDARNAYMAALHADEASGGEGNDDGAVEGPGQPEALAMSVDEQHEAENERQQHDDEEAENERSLTTTTTTTRRSGRRRTTTRRTRPSDGDGDGGGN